MGFPGGSDGKESTCNAGELSSILGWDDPVLRCSFRGMSKPPAFGMLLFHASESRNVGGMTPS